MARAIKRLYEIRGIKEGPTGGNSATVAEIGKEVGKSERTIRTLRTIADLIPPPVGNTVRNTESSPSEALQGPPGYTRIDVLALRHTIA
jgi:hypothetical protein